MRQELIQLKKTKLREMAEVLIGAKEEQCQLRLWQDGKYCAKGVIFKHYYGVDLGEYACSPLEKCIVNMVQRQFNKDVDIFIHSAILNMNDWKGFTFRQMGEELLKIEADHGIFPI